MDIFEIRRARLLALIRDRFNGSQAALGRAIERPATMVWQLKAGRNAIGEVVARHIERRLDMPEGWMDTDPADSRIAEKLSGSELALVRAFRALPPDDQQHFLRTATAMSLLSGPAVNNAIQANTAPIAAAQVEPLYHPNEETGRPRNRATKR